MLIPKNKKKLINSELPQIGTNPAFSQSAITNAINQTLGIQTTSEVTLDPNTGEPTTLGTSSIYQPDSSTSFSNTVGEQIAGQTTAPTLDTNTGDSNVDRVNQGYNKGVAKLEKQKQNLIKLYGFELSALKQSSVSSLASTQNQIQSQAVADQIIYDSTGMKSPSMINAQAQDTMKKEVNTQYATYLSGAISDTARLYGNVQAINKLEINGLLELTSMEQDYFQFKAQQELAWQQYYLNEQMFQLQQEQFAWQKQMDQESLDLQKQQFQHQVDNDDWEMQFQTDQQDYQEAYDREYYDLQKQMI